jgi:hypothetical protein
MSSPPLRARIGLTTRIHDIEGNPVTYTVADEIVRVQSNNPEKTLCTHKLEFADGHIEVRFGYYMICKNGKRRGKWLWGQYAPMLPVDDLSIILKEIDKRGWLHWSDQPS